MKNAFRSCTSLNEMSLQTKHGSSSIFAKRYYKRGGRSSYRKMVKMCSTTVCRLYLVAFDQFVCGFLARSSKEGGSPWGRGLAASVCDDAAGSATALAPASNVDREGPTTGDQGDAGQEADRGKHHPVAAHLYRDVLVTVDTKATSNSKEVERTQKISLASLPCQLLPFAILKKLHACLSYSSFIKTRTLSV